MADRVQSIPPTREAAFNIGKGNWIKTVREGLIECFLEITLSIMLTLVVNSRITGEGGKDFWGFFKPCPFNVGEEGFVIKGLMYVISGGAGAVKEKFLLSSPGHPNGNAKIDSIVDTVCLHGLINEILDISRGEVAGSRPSCPTSRREVDQLSYRIISDIGLALNLYSLQDLTRCGSWYSVYRHRSCRFGLPRWKPCPRAGRPVRELLAKDREKSLVFFIGALYDVHNNLRVSESFLTSALLGARKFQALFK